MYKVYAHVTDDRGAKSVNSGHISIAVQSPGIILLGQQAVSAMSIIVPLAGLSVMLVLILWFGWTRVRKYSVGVQRETTEAEEVLHKTFDALREQVKDELRILDVAHAKRELTSEEEQLQSKMKEMFDIAEDAVGKEIRDINKLQIPPRVKIKIENVK